MLLFHHLHLRPVLMPGLDEPWAIIPMMYRIHFIPIVRLVINILVEVVYVLELIQDEEWILIMHIMFWRSNYIKNDGGLTSIWVLGSIKKMLATKHIDGLAFDQVNISYI